MWFSKKQKRGWGYSTRKSRKSAFGGEVKTHKEIKDLTSKIKKVEKEELEAFEENFDEVWEKAEKK